MTEAKVCPLCHLSFFRIERVRDRDMFEVACQKCGRYWVTGSVIRFVAEQLSDDERRILRGQTRIATRRGAVLQLSSYSIPEIVAAAVRPTNPVEVAERLLVDVSKDAKTFFGSLAIEAERYLDYFLPTVQDLYHLVHSLKDRGYLRIEGQDAGSIHVTFELSGWERVRELEHSLPGEWRAFVAMSFDTSMDDAWIKGILPALQEAGYDAIRVDKVPHLGKIDDKILAELRRASIVVADFTMHRNGVYFEAGFALGRGVPVVWTCRDDDIGASHFDTRQYSHVCWANPADLREKLRDRLLATVPTRSAVVSPGAV